MTRREALRIGGVALAAGAVSRVSQAQGVPDKGRVEARRPQAAAAVRPLPFDPKKLRGISEKMIVSHHDNNYVAAINGVNKVRDHLAQAGKDTPGFVVSGLRQSELQYANSIILHEHYFANLGGDGKPGASMEKTLAAAFGSMAQFEESFRATGAGLGGGSGWAVLALNFHTGHLEITGSNHHTQALAFAQPILVMDMYEHAYQMDYGSAAAKYIDAFWQNIQWDEVQHRWERASKVAASLRG